MDVDTAVEQQRPLHRKRTRRWFLDRTTRTAVVISAGAGIIGAVSALTELANQPTEEQKEAERLLQDRSLKSFVVTDEGSGDLRVSRGLAIRNTSHIDDPKTPSGIIERLPEGTSVRGIIWRTDYNPKDPSQEREWAAVKYERGGQEIIGFTTTRYLKEIKHGTNYSK